MKGQAVNVTREQTPRCETEAGAPPLSPSFGDKVVIGASLPEFRLRT